MKLKYCIQAYLNSLTRKEHTILMKALLIAIAPTQRSTFHRWRTIKAEDRTKIPDSKLEAIANVIGCEPGDLKRSVEQIKKTKKIKNQASSVG